MNKLILAAPINPKTENIITPITDKKYINIVISSSPSLYRNQPVLDCIFMVAPETPLNAIKRSVTRINTQLNGGAELVVFATVTGLSACTHFKHGGGLRDAGASGRPRSFGLLIITLQSAFMLPLLLRGKGFTVGPVVTARLRMCV